MAPPSKVAPFWLHFFSQCSNKSNSLDVDGINLMFYYKNHFVHPTWSAIFEEIIIDLAADHSIGR